jgi:hypothetical protein
MKTDWLHDPLMSYENGLSKYKKPKNLKQEVLDKWYTFHFATRLKLEGADYFCRLALGFSSMPSELGLPLLAHRMTKWHLDAFFLEIISAYDTLLQEINILYEILLDIGKVKWSNNKFKNALPEELKKLMEKGQDSEWFKKISWYRNTATHHAYVPTNEMWSGHENTLNFDEHETSLEYFDKTNSKTVEEDIKKACPSYLKNMVSHIQSIWVYIAKDIQFS